MTRLRQPSRAKRRLGPPPPLLAAALASRAAGGSAGSSQARGGGRVPTWPLITGADSGRFLALAAASLLLLAVVAADEPLSSPEPTSSASSQSPAPLANSEPLITGKSEASGESEIASPVEQATTGGPPVSFAQADRSHTEEMNGDLLHSDASNLGSFSLDPFPGDAQSGLDHEVDSEESLTSPGM
ncbi:uncharacterized protein LOC131196371 isoform X2 [Ahaetulla prasina]|uniref:uncharacterized protein LOC131196371 isoform X2 n=1 Tax=Ahaetulla prasina TaxID=499056 RepID=UPI002649E189|nr:uncharacterized protein LOC131196371 isoform X2 [Ahaetulla prasina]